MIVHIRSDRGFIYGLTAARCDPRTKLWVLTRSTLFFLPESMGCSSGVYPIDLRGRAKRKFTNFRQFP